MADVASCCRGVCCAVLKCAGRGRRGISQQNIRLKAVFTKLIQSQEQILIQSGGNKYTADSLCAHMGVNREICRHIYIHTYAYIYISVCMCLWLRTEWKRVNTNAIEFILKCPKKGGHREREKERCLSLCPSLLLSGCDANNIWPGTGTRLQFERCTRRMRNLYRVPAVYNRAGLNTTSEPIISLSCNC